MRVLSWLYLLGSPSAGRTGPHEITVRAKAKSTSTSQKSFYYRPATSSLDGARSGSRADLGDVAACG